MSVARRLGLLALAALLPLLLVLGAFVLWVYSGVTSAAAVQTGTLTGNAVSAPVRIARDERGIPHIRAANERDLFFGEGYAQAADRLFQLDVYRRAVSGRLSEIFGSSLLNYDQRARTFDVESAVDEEERSLAPREHEDLVAFAAGVQKAIDERPLPPEFRILGYRPEPWRPRDALLVAFNTVVALADPWDEVLTREDVRRSGGEALLDAFYPVTDPAYDAPLGGAKPAPVASLAPLTLRDAAAPPLFAGLAAPEHGEVGSNDFTAGAALTATHRALLANDPHLGLRIPGIWYLVEMSAPGYHVAGATLAGVPGVILGHNEHLAWGVTNGTVATTRIYRERFRSATSDEYYSGGRWLRAAHRHEHFSVRFGKALERDYLATIHGFVFADRGTERYAAAWTGVDDRRSLEPRSETDEALSDGTRRELTEPPRRQQAADAARRPALEREIAGPVDVARRQHDAHVVVRFEQLVGRQIPRSDAQAAKQYDPLAHAARSASRYHWPTRNSLLRPPVSSAGSRPRWSAGCEVARGRQPAALASATMSRRVNHRRCVESRCPHSV